MADKDKKGKNEEIITGEEAAEKTGKTENPADCGTGEQKTADREKQPEKNGAEENKVKEDNEKLVKSLKADNEKLTKSLADTTDRYMRMMAEYDNFRKRTAKERESVYTEAYSDALAEIITVKDSLELAVKYSDKEKFIEGVVMTLNKFSDSLKKLGIEEYGSVGEQFDPMIHNAVMTVEDDSHGENEIAEVLLKGYKKGEKIIRYAMVKVAN